MKVRVLEGLQEATLARLGTGLLHLHLHLLFSYSCSYLGKKKGAKETQEVQEPVIAVMHFKRFVFDLQKKMVQS